jgi:transposase
MIIMASASGTPVPAIARLVAAHEDTVRDVIHAFNEMGLDALDPRWAGGRPRRISDEDQAFIIETATTRAEKLDRPFTHWSIRKLAQYLADNPVRTVAVGRERLRQLLRRNKISFQRTVPGRSPPTRTRRPNSTASRRSPPSIWTGVSPSTSSGRCPSAPPTAAPGNPSRNQTGYRPPTGAPTASATSTAATASATTSYGE